MTKNLGTTNKEMDQALGSIVDTAMFKPRNWPCAINCWNPDQKIMKWLERGVYETWHIREKMWMLSNEIRMTKVKSNQWQVNMIVNNNIDYDIYNENEIVPALCSLQRGKMWFQLSSIEVSEFLALVTYNSWYRTYQYHQQDSWYK